MARISSRSIADVKRLIVAAASRVELAASGPISPSVVAHRHVDVHLRAEMEGAAFEFTLHLR